MSTLNSKNPTHHRPNKPRILPPVTTYQGLDSEARMEAPPLSVSTPVRCSLGEKSRPEGFRNLLDKRLQKGPLTPVTVTTTTSTTVNQCTVAPPKSTTAATVSTNAKPTLTVQEKANKAYKKKKNIKDELKRQSSLAAAAAAAASSPIYIAQLTQQMKATDEKQRNNKEKRQNTSQTTNAPTMMTTAAYATPPMQRSILGAIPLPRHKVTPPNQAVVPHGRSDNYFAPIQHRRSAEEEEKLTIDTTGRKCNQIQHRQHQQQQRQLFPPQQQTPSSKADLYYEPSPMSRLRTTVRSKSPARPRATSSLNNYLYRNAHQENGERKGNIMHQEAKDDENDGDERNGVVHQEVNNVSDGDVRNQDMDNNNVDQEVNNGNVEDESNRNGGDSSKSVSSGQTTVENGVEMTYSMTNQDMNDENCGDENNKPAIREKLFIKLEKDEKPLQAAATTLVESMLFKSKNHKSLLRLQTSDSNDSLVSKPQSLSGLKNRDFGKTKRSLLMLKDPRIELQKSLSKQSQKSTAKKTKKTAPKYHRRADMIQHHRSNVGSTLKSIGIEPKKHALSKKAQKKISPRATAPKKKRRALSTIMASPKKQINNHRRKVYEAIQAKRSLLVQARRGIATPRTREVTYQRYSFLERKRLGILESGLIKSQDFDNCSSNTVVSVDSTSSSYCDEMLAQVRELRKARLSLSNKKLRIPIIEGISEENANRKSTITAQSPTFNSSYELATQVVKRRNARVSLAIERTWSTESQLTSASDKRRKAMHKIRRNKMKALGLEPEC